MITLLRRNRLARSQRGQATVETALGLPLLLTLAFNMINFGYFWFMVLALSAAPRHAVQYASQGGVAGTSSAPSSTDVRDVVYNNMTKAVSGATTSNVGVQVCIANNGAGSAAGSAACQSYNSSVYSFSDSGADPEPTYFTLQRVAVAYRVTPLIPGGVFNVVVPSDLTFRRQVSMRNLYGIGGGS